MSPPRADPRAEEEPSGDVAPFEQDGATPLPLFPEQTQLRVTFSTVQEALVVVDDERTYVCANEAAERILGLPAQEIIGRRIGDFTTREHWPELDRLWRRLQAVGQLEGECVVQRADGGLLPITFRANWWFAPGRHLVAALEERRWPPATRGRLPDRVLTQREQQILVLVADGQTVPQIAARLVVSESTVKTHLAHVYAKLRVRDRAAAVATALRWGIIA